MNETSQVVIIGAGIQGLSIAYHLAKSGITDVIVVEKEFIGAGSSGRSASMLMMQRENEAKIRLSQYSYQRYMGFKDELGIDIGFKKIGFLSVVPERKKDIALEMALLRQKLGVKTDILTPEEIKKLVPFVNLDGILFGVFGPDDGVIDPHSIMQGFANRAKDLGVTIRQGVNATGIKIQNNKVVAVETTEGVIFTSFVVNAAGAKAKEVAQWVGVNLPIANRVRSIFITDQFPDIPSDGPMVEDADVEWYYRKEGPGVLMGMGKEETRNVSMSINWDFLPKVIEFATYRVPILASASILRGWSGVRPLTPDITPIIGPVQELEGFINCCGWGGEGVMHAPAGGQIVSEYITGVKDKTFSLDPFCFLDLEFSTHIVARNSMTESSPNYQPLWKYHLGFLFYTFLWAGKNLYSSRILQTIDPLLFTFWIGIIASISAVVIRVITLGFGIHFDVKNNFKYILPLVLGTGLGLLGANYALTRMSAVLYSLIDISLYPLFANVLAYLFVVGEKDVNYKKVFLGLVLAILGAALFFLQDVGREGLHFQVLALFASIISEIGWAISIISISNLIRNDVQIIDIIVVRFAAVAIILSIVVFLQHPFQDVGFIQKHILEIFVVSFFGFVIPFILSFNSLSKLSVSVFTFYSFLVPIFTFGLSALIFKDQVFNLNKILGGLLMASSILVTRGFILRTNLKSLEAKG